jgi:hypothetical protein
MLAAERTPAIDVSRREEVRPDMIVLARQLLRCGADINVTHGHSGRGCTAA